MAYNSNPGYAFPLEKLGSDLSRNQFNYEAILNALIEWNKTTDSEVRIRMAIDTSPWFTEYTIPSKSALATTDGTMCEIDMYVPSMNFAVGGTGEEHSNGCELQIPAYGGRYDIPSLTVDGLTACPAGPYIINLPANQPFAVNDFIKIDRGSVTATIDTSMTSDTIYKIGALTPTVDGFAAGILDENGDPIFIMFNGDSSGNIIISKYFNQSTPIPSESDEGDVVTIRTAISTSINTLVQLFYSPQIPTWSNGESYTYGNYVIYNGVIYSLLSDVYYADITPDLDTVNYSALITTYDSLLDYQPGSLVTYNGSLYITNIFVQSGGLNPDVSDDWNIHAPLWVSGTIYESGAYVMSSNGLPYLATTQVGTSNTPPHMAPTRWTQVLYIPYPNSMVMNRSFSSTWKATRNIQSVALRNVGDGYLAPMQKISLSATIRGMANPSIYQKTTGVYETSNYVMWPINKLPAWLPNQNYSTDIALPVTGRQIYTASMVYDHTKTNSTTTINWINYDGPDLDRGLVIYLPVLVETSPNEYAEPEDGFTYEFFFRIWPNTAYTNAVTCDHIINKAQIYVYSANTYSEISGAANCTDVIAKFSMSRLTNFYMFGENTSIPDKPVCYRATFAYSKAQKRWVTTDYYQLPDHLFLGPIGYIDPQNPANLDINQSVIGDIGPNPAFVGYETAALPLFQDPFSDDDLSPVRFENSADYINFKNRII